MVGASLLRNGYTPALERHSARFPFVISNTCLIRCEATIFFLNDTIRITSINGQNEVMVQGENVEVLGLKILGCIHD